MKKEKWFVANKKADFQKLAEKFQISPALARLIRNRDIIEEGEVFRFLRGGISEMYDGMQMKGMKKGIELLQEKIKQRNKIRVISDYDVDGCCAGTILVKAIKRCGGVVDFDIPDRLHDGYGINERIVEKAHKDGIDLIITCDNGISALAPIDLAKKLGMQVIITDHHEVPFEEKEGKKIYAVPNADAVINPKQPEDCYPFKSLCGAGIAYKLAEVLYEKSGILKTEAQEFLQIAAIATICDIVDLKDENRILVKLGMEQLRHTKNVGLLALMEECSLSGYNLSYYHIGFVLGPSINASGRLDTARKAMNLLMSENKEEANILARELKQLNDERKNMTAEAVKQAVELIESTELKKDKVFVLFLKCHESVAGIVAGRIRERYYRPVFILTTTEEEGMIKGSGRSIESYHMFEALLGCRDILTKFGGHPMAAGLSMEAKNLELFRQRLNEQCTLTEQNFIEKITVDFLFPVRNLSEEFIQEIKCLEPFGKGNSKPLFAETEFSIQKAMILGKNKNVLKMQMIDKEETKMDALFFGDIEELKIYIEKKYGKEEMFQVFQGEKNSVKLDFVYYPEINEFRGNKSIQIIVQNYR